MVEVLFDRGNIALDAVEIAHVEIGGEALASQLADLLPNRQAILCRVL